MVHTRIIAVLLALLIPVTGWAGDLNKDLLNAAKKGKTDKVIALLAQGADVNAKDKKGETALYLAAKNGHVSTIRVLLEAVADVNAKTKKGDTALSVADKNGHADIVKVLLRTGADAPTWEGSALVFTIKRGYTDVVPLLLEKGVDVNAWDVHVMTALMWAAEKGYTDIVKVLLDKGADVHVRMRAYRGIRKGPYIEIEFPFPFSGSNALMLATLRGHTDIVRLLLDHGADPNMKVIWEDPFIFYEGWVLGFLSPGESKAVFINEARTTREATPLIVAAGLGHIDIVRALLSAGADVNAKDEKGLRALTWALMNGHTDILVLLSKHGAKE